MTGQTENDDTKLVEMISLKYLNNFWRTLGIPLINFEINLQLHWPRIFFLIGWYCGKSRAKI